MKSIVDLKVGSVVYSKTGFRKLARDNGLGKGDSFIGEGSNPTRQSKLS